MGTDQRIVMAIALLKTKTGTTTDSNLTISETMKMNWQKMASIASMDGLPVCLFLRPRDLTQLTRMPFEGGRKQSPRRERRAS